MGLLAAVLLVLNIALILQNRKLKQALGESGQGPVPTVGTTIKRLDGTRLNGSRFIVPFDHDSGLTLLLVFSTNCHFCDLNWPQWSLVTRSLEGRAVRVVYINLNSKLTSDYLGQHGVTEGQVYDQLDPREQVALNLYVTPLTVLLDANGRVGHVWVGALGETDLAQLRSELARELSR